MWVAPNKMLVSCNFTSNSKNLPAGTYYYKCVYNSLIVIQLSSALSLYTIKNKIFFIYIIIMYFKIKITES